MYQCKKHGILKSEWCEGCQTVVECDCKDQTATRFKDMIYDSEEGERTITIRLYHCATCGMPSRVEI